MEPSGFEQFLALKHIASYLARFTLGKTHGKPAFARFLSSNAQAFLYTEARRDSDCSNTRHFSGGAAGRRAWQGG